VRFEVAVLFTPLSDLEVLENPCHPPFSPSFVDRAQNQRSPFRVIAAIRTSVSIECLDLMELDGAPHVAFARRDNVITIKDLTSRTVKVLRCAPLNINQPHSEVTRWSHTWTTTEPRLNSQLPIVSAVSECYPLVKF